jgi:hypothetical protein
MGSSSWNSRAYTSYASTVADLGTKEIFTETKCHPDLDPSKFALRESCDSEANPCSTPVIVGVDDTGSMGHLATEIIKQGLGVIVEGIRNRKPISDPHILLAAIGDATCDTAPLQTTQFEADVVITKQIEKFYIEQGGGGNNGESYALLWWFAANKTVCDSFVLRKKKGYLFTIGDESYLPIIHKEEIIKFLGGTVQADIQIRDLLSECEEKWEVFHLITPTSATAHQGAIQRWKDLLGQRVVVVDDYTKLGEVIVSIMQVNEGQNKEDVIGSWSGDTSLTVAGAVRDLVAVGASTPGVSVTEITEI